MLGFEIDLQPHDPVFKPGLQFEEVFGYEQVLVAASDRPLAFKPYIEPQHLAKETLITYPVPIERLDIYKQFLLPADITPKQHKTIETTDITRQAGGQGTLRGCPSSVAGARVCGGFTDYPYKDGPQRQRQANLSGHPKQRK